MGKPFNEARWLPGQFLAFRFAFAYVFLYIFPFPVGYIVSALGALPLFAGIAPEVAKYTITPYADMWRKIVQWVGANCFDVTIVIASTGSGDTMFNFVQAFCYVCIAAAVVTLWSILDWTFFKPANHSRLHVWLRVYVRFYLAAFMIVYGAFKVIKSQFPYPTLDRLVQPFGDASPMGLLWTFMGASPAYEIFSGAGELLGGLLLTTRRTTLLGALVSAGVLIQIVALNFCYDVPVKLFSTHLLVMALWLAGPDLGRIANLFLLHRATDSQPIQGLTRWRWLDWLLVALRTLMVGGFVYLQVISAMSGSKFYAEQKVRSPLYGVWSV